MFYHTYMAIPQVSYRSTFPYDGLTVSSENFTEVNVYIQIPANVTVSEVSYWDDSLGSRVTLERASNVSVNYYWIPDLNGDGKVDDYEVNELSKYYGQDVPPAPEEYDFDGDGRINIADVAIIGHYYGVTIYRTDVTWNLVGGTRSFKFHVESSIGAFETGGTFEIVEPPPEEGKEEIIPVIPPNPFPAPEEPSGVPLSFIIILAGGAFIVWGVFKIKPNP